jgi:hypothetical protein
MLRKITQTLFCSIAFSIVTTGQVKSDKEHNGILGNVHQIKTEVAKVNLVAGNPTEGKRELKRTDTYDKKGNLTERVNVVVTAGLPNVSVLGGKATTRQVFVHDKNGARVEFDYPVTDRSNIRFPGAGARNDGSLQINWFLKFDPNGNRIFEEVVLIQGTHLYKNIYSYDGNGRKTEMFHHVRDESRSVRSVYSYDDKGSVSEEASYKSDGSLKEKLRYSYEYDEAKNWVKRASWRVVSKDGQEFLEPIEVSYRTITYFH